jgi:hypothetical protein
MTGKFKRSVWPEDTARRIQDARTLGASWQVIADGFGCSMPTVRAKAIELGLHAPRQNRRFTAEDDAILRADYVSNADLEVTAKKIGCSYGVLCQRLYHHHKDILGGRTPQGTKAIKKYGLKLLEHGSTPTEASQNIKAKIVAAKAAARVAALNAKERHNNQIIETMVSQVASGKDRNAAIFEARALGATLERIASCFDITRERIRQICDAEAFRRTLEPSLTHEEKPVVRRDFLLVGSQLSQPLTADEAAS